MTVWRDGEELTGAMKVTGWYPEQLRPGRRQVVFKPVYQPLSQLQNQAALPYVTPAYLSEINVVI